MLPHRLARGMYSEKYVIREFIIPHYAFIIAPTSLGLCLYKDSLKALSWNSNTPEAEAGGL